ncbi:hypothetical protein V1477_004975 [Vespula maculifrons]|uniref:Uncharacterized protein n=1 Tax=Vespula maculifrons TaxID=7453 RepID=A0ABD2CPH0_VESMC
MNELVTSFNALRVTIEGFRKEKNPEEKSKTTGPSSGRTSHVDPLENPNRREIKSTVSLSPDGSHFSDGTVTMKPREILVKPAMHGGRDCALWGWRRAVKGVREIRKGKPIVRAQSTSPPRITHQPPLYHPVLPENPKTRGFSPLFEDENTREKKRYDILLQPFARTSRKSHVRRRDRRFCRAKKYRANLGPPPPPLLPPPPATSSMGSAGMSAASQLYSHATCSTVGEHRINAETAGSFGPAYYLSRPLAAIDWLPISNACNEPFQEPAVGFFCEIPEIFKETYTKTYLD